MKLARLFNFDQTPRGWCHYCPACESIHCFTVEGDPRYPKEPRWSFNGSAERPTFGPRPGETRGSMLLFTTSRTHWIIERVDKRKRGLETYATEGAARAALPNDRWAAKRIDGGRQTVCHYHLIDGELRYCADSPHALAGKNVPLPDLPERHWPENYKYGGGS